MRKIANHLVGKFWDLSYIWGTLCLAAFVFMLLCVFYVMTAGVIV